MDFVYLLQSKAYFTPHVHIFEIEPHVHIFEIEFFFEKPPQEEGGRDKFIKVYQKSTQIQTPREFPPSKLEMGRNYRLISLNGSLVCSLAYVYDKRINTKRPRKEN